MRGWLRVAAALFAIGYGANQFSSLMVMYREQGHYPAVTVAAFFGVYAAGLAPGLLLGGPASDRWGRRRMLLPSLMVSVPASGVLALGGVVAVSQPALYTGRFLFGVVTGIAMAAGTSWVKELSQAPWDPAADVGSGARRAALALSTGFGIGPLVAGVLAQWAPLPMELPYLVHIALTLVVVVAVARVPETRPPGAVRSGLRVQLPARFRRVVAPMAPWVFGAPALSFAVQPAALGPLLAGIGLVYATLLTTVTLGAGIAVQSWARRLSPVTGSRLGLAALVAGILLAAVAAAFGSPMLAVTASAVLGGSYGLCLVAGLLEVQKMAEPAQLGGLTAVYYAITYIGFLLPVALAALTGLAGYPVLLLGVALLATLSLAVVARTGRAPVDRAASATSTTSAPWWWASWKGCPTTSCERASGPYARDVLELRPTPFDHPDAARLIAEIQQIYRERYGGEDETLVDPREFDEPEGFFVVGYVAGRPVACGGWRVRRAGEAPALRDGDAEVKRMYVAGGHRGHGYARAVLAELERTAGVAGRRRIVLETGTRQPEAIALYTSAGYAAMPGFGAYRDSPTSRYFAKQLDVLTRG